MAIFAQCVLLKGSSEYNQCARRVEAEGAWEKGKSVMVTRSEHAEMADVS